MPFGSASASNSVTNSGAINGGNAVTYSGADGIQFEDNTAGTVTNQTGGIVSGDRHAINAGVGSTITVVNNLGAIITGHNGSGVGSDGTASVTNFGTITGAFSNSPGSDINGPLFIPDGINDGDGDGIDIDGQATVVNHGLIEGTGAGGHGSDGLPNTSEGLAAGGGSIGNRSGATIRGLGLGILIDDSSQGPAPFQTTILNNGTIEGTNSTGIQIISTLADVIENNGTISGGAGTAILFGGGDNTLRIGASSVINGLSDGEGGLDRLDYSTHGTAGVTVNLGSGAATGTVGVQGFENVIGSAGRDDLTGDSGANSLIGGNAADTLSGAGSNDTLNGGGNHDSMNGGGGNDNLRGGAANDTLTGSTGDDMLRGDLGDDRLTGGAGQDQLNGSAGLDTFDFNLASESALGALRDVIGDFEAGTGRPPSIGSTYRISTRARSIRAIRASPTSGAPLSHRAWRARYGPSRAGVSGSSGAMWMGTSRPNSKY